MTCMCERRLPFQKHARSVAECRSRFEYLPSMYLNRHEPPLVCPGVQSDLFRIHGERFKAMSARTAPAFVCLLKNVFWIDVLEA